MDSDDSDDEAPLLMAVEPDDPPDLLPAPQQQHEEEQQEQEEIDLLLPPCPVTILSGFLGAGKTTLIQYILQSPNHGKRIAVIENEFGDGLDVESLIARDGSDEAGNLQDLIELPNGCICCTVKDSLVATLENLIDKRNDLDYILIEASGMANPGPIASVFWLDDALESRLRLDGIVTLVDAHHIERQVNETEEASQQIAYADRLLINKIDLLKEDQHQVDKIMSLIRRIHPTAPIQTTSFSKVPDLDWILDANCFGGQNRVEELDRMLREAEDRQNTTTDTISSADLSRDHSHGHTSSQEHSHSLNHDHSHNGDNCTQCQEAQAAASVMSHKHTNEVSTIALREHGSIDLAKINKWLADILWPNQDEKDQVLTAMLQESENENGKKEHLPDDSQASSTATTPQSQSTSIYRIKGILSVLHDEMEPESYKVAGDLDSRRYIVQAVHDLWEVYPASDELQWSKDEPRECKLVIIGRRLDRAALQAGFLSCFVEHTPKS